MKWHPVGRSWPGLAQTLSIPQITTHQRIALTGRLIKHISLLGKYKKENKPRMVQFAAGDQASPSVAADAAAPDTSAAPVAVITTAGCSYCKRVKATLKDAGIHFQEFALTDDLEALAEVKRTTGQSTVPQVFIAGQLLGGSSEVDAALADGTLQTLIIKAEDAPALPEGVRKVLQGRQASPLDSTSGSTGSMQAQAAEALAREMLDGGIDSSTAPFALEDAAQWLVHEKGLTHSAAIEQLGDLQAAQRLTIAAGVDPKTPLKDVKETSRVLLRWVAQCPAPTEWDVPLNAQFVWFGPSRPAVQVSSGSLQCDLGDRIALFPALSYTHAGIA